MKLTISFKSLNDRYNINLAGFFNFKNFFIFNYYRKKKIPLNDDISNMRDKNYFFFN